MAKDNYKNEFEQSRQEIDMTEGADGKKVLSRVDLHAAANTVNRSRFSLINILLVIFTLIPISILAFVLFSLIFNNEPITPKVEDNTIQFEKGNKPGGSAAAADDEKEQDEQTKEEKQKQEELKKKEAEKKKQAEEKQKAEEKKKKEEKRKEEEKQKAEEQRKAEEQKQKAEEERKRAEEERQKAEAEKQQQQPAGSHVVQPGETLYRVSVIHYGNGDGVEKIRSANGISGNAISVGQTLVIPK